MSTIEEMRDRLSSIENEDIRKNMAEFVEDEMKDYNEADLLDMEEYYELENGINEFLSTKDCTYMLTKSIEELDNDFKEFLDRKKRENDIRPHEFVASVLVSINDGVDEEHLLKYARTKFGRHAKKRWGGCNVTSATLLYWSPMYSSGVISLVIRGGKKYTEKSVRNAIRNRIGNDDDKLTIHALEVLEV